jgi:hypothetical protein
MSDDEAQAQAQAIVDAKRAIFESALRIRLSREELHRAMLFSMATKPSIDYTKLELGWMQMYPENWPGYHPEECESVAIMSGIGKDV